SGDGDEAVEIPDATGRRVEVDRVAAAEESGHDRLGNTRRKHCGHRHIGGATAVLENLDSGRSRCRMARRYSRLHGPERIAASPDATFAAGQAVTYLPEPPLSFTDVREAAAELPLVHARGLVKRFGALLAVDGIDFDVSGGEAFGFLGPNGAGQNSTLRVVGCVSPPSSRTLPIPPLGPVTARPH